MNDAMRKKYWSKKAHQIRSDRKIKLIIQKQLLDMAKYEFEDKTWIAEKNQTISYEDIIEQYGTLSDYERIVEFYFCKDLLKSNWRDSIGIIVYEFEQLLNKLGFGNKFVLTVIGQCGKFENLNVRLQLYRDSEINLNQIDSFDEPILVEILEFDN